MQSNLQDITFGVDNAGTQLIECVPNFSVGQDKGTIDAIAKAIQSVIGVYLLHQDIGYGANRSVFTFVGEPHAVIEAAFRAIAIATERIDMRTHKGTHPRMGATDVCPIVPLKGVSMEQAVQFSKILAERVGSELTVPVYLYENSAHYPFRKLLADIRSGEYEGIESKMKNPEWKPDYGPELFNAKSGATVIGAHKVLLAYNVNLNTQNIAAAKTIASWVREKGTPKKPPPASVFGKFQGVRAIGWLIPEHNYVQVSMNITDYEVSPLHAVFRSIVDYARSLGLYVTGSELIGLAPLQVFVDAGIAFLREQGEDTDTKKEHDLVQIAIKTLRLDELSSFSPTEKIIEYKINSLSNAAS